MLTNTRAGFTIVELIVVIAVIGILAAVAAFSFIYTQKDARDDRRAVHASTVAEALEKYYDKHGEYPSCQALTGSAEIVTGDNGALEGTDQSVLVMPLTPAGTSNALICGALSPTGQDDSMGYVGDGTPNCATVACTEFTLQYRSEQAGTIQSIASRR